MTATPTDSLQLRWLGLQPYDSVYQEMLAYTEQRDADTPDQIWLLQHPRVFTQGQAGKAEHVLMPGDIPVVQSDRGGQVTYHGPGQLVVYLLIDIKRRGMGPRQLVSLIEQAIVDALQHWHIDSAPRSDAPGVYVQQRKIASLGLRIRQGRCFHGLALNIDMDLEPFARINPCGYEGMQMTQMVAETDQPVVFDEVAERLAQALTTRFAESEELA
ncbi:hypothetical protein GCM10011297_09810 [Bacterioplanes sanyensis]|uniref:lipoyl(octanoyl) transferase LipB n=1 Tax=Bacterioplanes sanyensis TaxID=1249553 RepID=UPI001674248A|nr:lipoyl(octanoyl) transferase LipB [Bacterioplanes sanyensis]GGY38661.1 hypothetical protein GCM10011297_09810 [Bacterioplanes sanyensis]